MLTWFLPADLLGWVVVAGMAAMLVAVLFMAHPLGRLALSILVVLAMSWQIHHKGRLTERAVWQAKAKAEDQRQDRANREAVLEAERDIAERRRELEAYERRLEDIQREVEQAENGGDIVLDRADIDRLNRMRR